MIQNMVQNVMSSRLFNLLLLFTIIGEFLVPLILGHYYKGYDDRTMVMSALGSPQSPVRVIYNTWLIWLGLFLTFVGVVYFLNARINFPILSVLLLISIVTFAVGAGLISGIFSVNETKDIITTASKIHGVSAAIGFMTLLFLPLLNGIISFKQDNATWGFVDIIAFVLSLVFFICFIMGDKEQFKNTILGYEGLWERLSLFFMYVPFIHIAIERLSA